MQGIKRAEWSGETLGFMGRYNEPRKGLKVLINALPIISRFLPNIKVLVAGPGNPEEFLKEIDPQLRNRIKFLGRLSEEEKADFMSSVDAYVAPNTGGESFGIILAEAMASGTPIVASDLPAFVQVLSNGRFGLIFQNENSSDLAKQVILLAHQEEKRKALSVSATEGAERFDWDTVGPEIMNVYLHAIGSGEKVSVGSEQRGWLKFLNREES